MGTVLDNIIDQVKAVGGHGSVARVGMFSKPGAKPATAAQAETHQTQGTVFGHHYLSAAELQTSAGQTGLSQSDMLGLFKGRSDSGT